MKNKKVLFILHLPPPVHGASMVGKYIHDSETINNTFECHYLNLTLAKDINDIGKGGIRKLKDFYKLLTQIRKQVKSIKPQLCYVTPNAKGGAFYKEFFVVLLLKILNQKIIIHYHNKGVATRQSKWFDNLLYKIFFKNIKVILLAENLYQDIKKYVKYKDVYICPNGIPVNPNLPTTIKKEFNILFLSNMMKEKGVWDLVESCRILKINGRSVKCHFVGKWSDITKEKFAAEINKRGLKEYVSAYGAKYNGEKDTFLQKTDVFVFPTYYNNECFPLVLLEAMEQGIPCISTNEGGIPAIIEDGKTGYIVEKHSPEKIAEKIEYLMDHPEQCTAMGKAGKEKFLKEFTLDKFENRMKEILMDCVTSIQYQYMKKINKY